VTKLTENTTQAVARDVLASTLPVTEARMREILAEALPERGVFRMRELSDTTIITALVEMTAAEYRALALASEPDQGV
jgi:hypothetical protein